MKCKNMSFKKWYYDIWNPREKMTFCNAVLIGKSASDDDLITKTIKVDFKGMLFINDDRWIWNCLLDAGKDETIKIGLNKKAKEYLLELRKNNKMLEIHNGQFISGKHIITVQWNLESPEFVKATYEEYLAWIKERKNG